MRAEGTANKQTRESNSVANFLYKSTSGPESRRGDIGTTVVIDDSCNRDIDSGYDALAEKDRSPIMVRIAHLSREREAKGRGGICKNECCNSRDRFGEVWIIDKLIVRDPWAVLGSRVGAILDANGHGDDED